MAVLSRKTKRDLQRLCLTISLIACTVMVVVVRVSIFVLANWLVLVYFKPWLHQWLN